MARCKRPLSIVNKKAGASGFLLSLTQQSIQLMIFSGAYPLESRLPSVRDMAQEAAVNPNTMQRALAKLEEDGLIITHRTSGRSITEDASMVELAKAKLAIVLLKRGRIWFKFPCIHRKL